MKNLMVVLFLSLFLTGGIINAQNLQTIKLLTPVLENDKPFMQAIKERKSSREFPERELSLQDLSNTVWSYN